MNLHHQDGPFGELYECPDTTKSTENYRKILSAVEAALAKASSGTVQINDIRLYVRY